ncbi:MAG: hypothetical protein R3E97_03120 [Candidatus Eisenbacteria bacterium]
METELGKPGTLDLERVENEDVVVLVEQLGVSGDVAEVDRGRKVVDHVER